MIDEEKTDDSGILLGQMCYDELEPIKPQESQVENKIVDGQINLDDFLKAESDICQTAQSSSVKKQEQSLSSIIQKQIKEFSSNEKQEPNDSEYIEVETTSSLEKRIDGIVENGEYYLWVIKKLLLTFLLRRQSPGWDKAMVFRWNLLQ